VDLILALLLARFDAARRELAARRREDDGYSAETIAVIALLVVLALGAVGAIAVKIRAKADGIDLNAHP
jgi:uncharacterized protein HemX